MSKKIFLFTTLFLLSVSPQLTLATVDLTNTPCKPSYAPSIIIEKGNEADYGNYFLQMIAGGLLYLSGAVAVAVIAIGGLLYVSSRGDQNQMDKAKKTLTWAIIGLLTIIFSYTIVRSIIEIVYNTNSSQTQTTAPTPQATPTPTGGEVSGTPTN